MPKIYELLGDDSPIDTTKFQPPKREPRPREQPEGEVRPPSYCPWESGKFYLPKYQNRRDGKRNGQSKNN